MVEIITGVERRRNWRTEDKLRILAELDEPGAKFVDVARRNEVSRGLLWQWRDAMRRGTLVAEEATFMAVRVVPELPVAASPADPTTSSSAADQAVLHQAFEEGGPEGLGFGRADMQADDLAPSLGIAGDGDYGGDGDDAPTRNTQRISTTSADANLIRSLAGRPTAPAATQSITHMPPKTSALGGQNVGSGNACWTASLPPRGG